MKRKLCLSHGSSSIKKVLNLLLAAIIILSISIFSGTSADAKTIASAKGANIFCYALNSQGKSILLKVIKLDDLKALEHGQLSDVTSGEDTGRDYDISCTDNLPTTQYCEGKGFTIPELINYVKKVTTVSGADQLAYSGSDNIRLMATDSYGTYNRSWTYNDLYGVKRYYFEGLFDEDKGWQTGWEIDPEVSKSGMDMSTYNSQYKDSDPYYADKRTVIATGVPMTVILATESFSGRTTSKEIEASTEIGLANYISTNGGKVSGCVSGMLSDTWSLRLCIPMSETDLIFGHRTAYNNFKWIYNMRLDMTNPPSIVSLGTVARPQADLSLSSDSSTLTITMSCATTGASLYYSFDGSPQDPYTDPISVNVKGRDLSTNPVAFYMRAVKEGWNDAGIINVNYPGLAPNFKTLNSGLIGSDMTFSAADGVIGEEWNSWTKALNSISMKTPSGTGYAALGTDNYTIDDTAKTIGFKTGLFTEAGSYSFHFEATKYVTKNVSLSMKKAAPKVDALEEYSTGSEIGLTFSDTGYQNGMKIYVTLPGGSKTMISSVYLDRSHPGRVSITSNYFNQSSCQITGPGVYMLELVNDSYSPASQSIAINIVNLILPANTATTSPIWDLNGDGKCNLDDAPVIVNHWGETGKPGWIQADVNLDGIINLGDVVSLGLHWGDTL